MAGRAALIYLCPLCANRSLAELPTDMPTSSYGSNANTSGGNQSFINQGGLRFINDPQRVSNMQRNEAGNNQTNDSLTVPIANNQTVPAWNEGNLCPHISHFKNLLKDSLEKFKSEVNTLRLGTARAEARMRISARNLVRSNMRTSPYGSNANTSGGSQSFISQGGLRSINDPQRVRNRNGIEGNGGTNTCLDCPHMSQLENLMVDSLKKFKSEFNTLRLQTARVIARMRIFAGNLVRSNIRKDYIRELPIVEVDQKGVLRCVICCEDFKLKETVRKVKCSHIFHEHCLLPWLMVHGTCPLCRTVLIEDNDAQDGGSAVITEPVIKEEMYRLQAAFNRFQSETIPAFHRLQNKIVRCCNSIVVTYANSGNTADEANGQCQASKSDNSTAATSSNAIIQTNEASDDSQSPNRGTDGGAENDE